MGKHTCHAYKCEVEVRPSLLMCKKHWEMVPKEIQSRVLQHFNPKQCEKFRRPSMEWLKAAREAVNFVTKAEGNWEV